MTTLLRKDDEFSKESLESLTKINQAVNRITKIVAGLRTLSRSDDTQKEEFWPVPCIQESIAMVKDIYRIDGIEIKSNIDDFSFDWATIGQADHFQQVIMNLLSNAKDAVSLAKTKLIEINLSSENESLIIEVSDIAVA